MQYERGRSRFLKQKASVEQPIKKVRFVEELGSSGADW